MEIKEYLEKFNIQGNVKSITPYGNGHINKTFLIITDKEQYIFQGINTYVFPNVSMLMNNINIVTNHLKKKNVETLDIVLTKDNKLYCEDGDYCYRLFIYANNTNYYESLDNMSMVFKLGKAFGNFHKNLADLDSKLLGEPIPFFHDTKKRFKDFASILEKNPCERESTCLEEIKYILLNERYASLIVDGLNDGSIKYHVTHNDPKINNILFDKNSNDVRCVIDLDTVMPGSVLYDVGDALRSLFTGNNEDNKDTSLLKVNLEIYKNFASGYISEMKDSLTERELELFPLSSYILALELGMRFLGDYINGDKYFHVDYPEHNLVRARTQIALAKDIMLHQDDLKDILSEILKNER